MRPGRGRRAWTEGSCVSFSSSSGWCTAPSGAWKRPVVAGRGRRGAVGWGITGSGAENRGTTGVLDGPDGAGWRRATGVLFIAAQYAPLATRAPRKRRDPGVALGEPDGLPRPLARVAGGAALTAPSEAFGGGPGGRRRRGLPTGRGRRDPRAGPRCARRRRGGHGRPRPGRSREAGPAGAPRPGPRPHPKNHAVRHCRPSRGAGASRLLREQGCPEQEPVSPGRPGTGSPASRCPGPAGVRVSGRRSDRRRRTGSRR